MTRILTITAAEWAAIQGGDGWIVCPDPADLLAAAAPCSRRYEVFMGCTSCRITLVGECPECRGTGHIPADLQRGEFWHCEACGGMNTSTRRKCGYGTATLGYAYAVGEVLPICGPGSVGDRPDSYIEIKMIHPRMDGRHQWDIHKFTRNDGGGWSQRAGSLVAALAHYGDLAALVSQWALQIRVAP